MKVIGRLSRVSALYRVEARGFRISTVFLSFLLLSAITALSTSPAHALTAAQGTNIYNGFEVFTTQTFNGNGRTCGTCHIPSADYTISPADIAGLTASAHQLVLGGTNATLENPTLVNKFALFNITDNANTPGTGNTPAGPFRASMQLSGLALSTLNDCPDATTLATVTEDNAHHVAVATTSTPPIFPLEVGEPIDIMGVTGTALGSGPVGAGYNGIGVYVVYSVNPPNPDGTVTFEYTATFGNVFFGLPPGSGGAVDALLTVGFFGPSVPGADVCSDGSLQTFTGNFATFPVDNGTRQIELGWAGDGAPIDDTLFTPPGTTDFNCKAAVDAANASSDVLDPVLQDFAMGAVRHHFAKTNKRVPGVDFRCPTPAELTEISAFQQYLGRQFPSGTPLELAFKAGTSFPGTQVSAYQPVITFKDATAELGKTIFLDPSAGCNFCHFNGGASLSESNIRTEPFGNAPLPFPGRNENEEQNVDLFTNTSFLIPSTNTFVLGGLDGLTAPVQIAGTDPGDGSPIGFNLAGPQPDISIFNVQSIIEAPRKKSFFHNGVFTTGIEDAASFYFTDAFAENGNSAGFTNPGFTNAAGLPAVLPRADGQAEAAVPGGPALALQVLANIYFPAAKFGGPLLNPLNTPATQAQENAVLTSAGGQDVLDTMGFFLRALNAVYSLADCERLMSDANTMANMGLPTTVQVTNCSTDLSDVQRDVSGAKVTVPSSYKTMAIGAGSLQSMVNFIGASKNPPAGIYSFMQQWARTLRQSVATISPELNNP